MSRKFNKIDLLSSAAMFGLAIMVLVKLAPTFLDQEEIQLPEQVLKQVKAQVQLKEKKITELTQAKLSNVILPAPPPLNIAPTSKEPKKTTGTAIKVSAKPSISTQVTPKTVSPLKAIKAPPKVAELKVSKPQTPKIEKQPKSKKFNALKETITYDDVKEEIQFDDQADRKVASKVEVSKIVVEKPIELTNILEPEIDQEDVRKFTSTRQSIPEEVKTQRPTPTTASTSVTASNHNVKAAQTGRSLLKFLEHGKGPAIEIIWPDQAPVRDRLYSHLTNCFGMVSAILTKAQFYKEGQTGPWALNPDLFSGFLRQPTGNLPQVERAQISRIQNQNGLSRSSAAVRLFPRQSDAILLGGLQQLIGDEYLNARHIQGQYVLNSSGLRLINIHVDGRSIDGDIYFKPIVRNCRGAV